MHIKLNYLGMMNIIGRIAAGLLAYLNSVNALVMTICALVFASISLFMQQYCTDYALLVVFCVIYGLCIGASNKCICICLTTNLKVQLNTFHRSYTIRAI